MPKKLMKNDNDFQVHLPLEILQKEKVFATKVHGAIEKNLNDKKKNIHLSKIYHLVRRGSSPHS